MEPAVFGEGFNFITAARAAHKCCLFVRGDRNSCPNTHLSKPEGFLRAEWVLEEVKAYASILDIFQIMFLSLLADLGMFLLQE